MAAGVGSYFRQMAPDTKLMGFEPLGSPSMYNSLHESRPVVLESIETFVDGASMKQTGFYPYVIFQRVRRF